jgi:transcriptional regulator with XRE-family HTH domain
MNLRELRRMADLTQWELAQRCGVSRMRLSLAECGQLALRPEEESAVRNVLLDAIKTRESKIRGILSDTQSVAV